VDAVTTTIAAEKGCRLVSTTFFHGTWVADPSVSAGTYAAFVRALTGAVRRINALEGAFDPRAQINRAMAQEAHAPRSRRSPH
jgi:hypothetical protein